MNLDSGHLSQYLRQNSIEGEILHLETDTPTVTAAAAAVGVHPDQIIKSVLFLADQLPVLVIANGLTRIDYKRLAGYLGTSRRRVKMATAAQVLAVTGYPAGAVPPFGHRQRIRTLVETAVLCQPVVYGGGGELHALMRLATNELQRVVGDEVVDLAKLTPPPESVN